MDGRVICLSVVLVLLLALIVSPDGRPNYTLEKQTSLLFSEEVKTTRIMNVFDLLCCIFVPLGVAACLTFGVGYLLTTELTVILIPVSVIASIICLCSHVALCAFRSQEGERENPVLAKARLALFTETKLNAVEMTLLIAYYVLIEIMASRYSISIDATFIIWFSFGIIAWSVFLLATIVIIPKRMLTLTIER